MPTENTETTNGPAKRVHVDLYAFVPFWQKSTSTKEVAKEFGITETSASGRAAYLRKKGVMLKKRAGGFRKGTTDWSALAKLAEKNTPKAAKAAK
jgi:transposase